jgi:type IV secretion system protein TrbL
VKRLNLVSRVQRMHPVRRFALTTSFALLALAVISVMMSRSASAQNVLQCTGTANIDALPNVFCNATFGWLHNGLEIAKRLFMILVGIELAWAAITYVLQKENLGEFLAAFILKMMGIWFFSIVMIEAPDWLPNILQSFVGLAGYVTSGRVQQVDALMMTLDPANVLQKGINISGVVFSSLPTPYWYNGDYLFHLGDALKADFTTMFVMFIAVIFATLVCFIVFMSFLIAAGQIIMTLIETYIMIGAGAVMLAFTGSRWTASFGEKYIGYTFSIGIKLFVTYIIVALGLTLFPDQTRCSGDLATVCATNTQDINAAGPMVLAYLLLAATAVIFMMLTMRLPGLAASMMNGSPSLSFGSAMSAAGAVAGAVSGTVGAVAGTAMGTATSVLNAAGGVFDAGVGTAQNLIENAKEVAAVAAGGAGGAAAMGGGGGGAAAMGGGGGGGMSGGGAPSMTGGTSTGGASSGSGKASGASGSSGGSNGMSLLEKSAALTVAKGAKDAALAVGGGTTDAVMGLAGGTKDAATAALSPLSSMDEGGGGGTVSIGLRMHE